MPEDGQTYYESRLMRAVEDVDARIKALFEEKNALLRQLQTARRERDDMKDVNRTNSAMRVMVERRVLDALQGQERPVSSTVLYRAARKANFELKEPTFRTYLHRMKNKGLLLSVGRGLWTLGQVASGSE